MYDPDEECKAIIATIKRLCEQKNMAPHALVNKAGISTSTISYLVNGKTKPQVYTILMLCNVLGVRISDLFDNNVVTTEISESRVQYITYGEEKLLECYRGLSDKKKAENFGRVESLMKQYKSPSRAGETSRRQGR